MVDADDRPLRILLAEDNPVNRKVFQSMLRRLGYPVDVATNGLEALQALEQRFYNIILMDVQMPEMDGLEATRAIRNRWPKGRPNIIAITAYAPEYSREMCLEAGMDDYINKPVKMSDLENIISKHLSSKSRLQNRN